MGFVDTLRNQSEEFDKNNSQDMKITLYENAFLDYIKDQCNLYSKCGVRFAEATSEKFFFKLFENHDFDFDILDFNEWKNEHDNWNYRDATLNAVWHIGYYVKESEVEKIIDLLQQDLEKEGFTEVKIIKKEKQAEFHTEYNTTEYKGAERVLASLLGEGTSYTKKKNVLDFYYYEIVCRVEW